MKNTSERIVAWAGFAGTVFITIGAFWLSFAALNRLAVSAGIDPAQAWMWPLIVDGLIVTSTIAVVAMKRERDRWYPWLLLIGSAVVSVSANALQALMPAAEPMPGALDAAVASVPPVVLLAVTHLAVILARRTQPPSTGTAVETSPGWSNAQEFLLSFLEEHEGLAATRTQLCRHPSVTCLSKAPSAGYSIMVHRSRKPTKI